MKIRPKTNRSALEIVVDGAHRPTGSEGKGGGTRGGETEELGTVHEESVREDFDVAERANSPDCRAFSKNGPLRRNGAARFASTREKDL